MGELIVQLRLLQYGVQAAFPIKDSGNDLIAVKSSVFKAIQVKTTTHSRFNVSSLPKVYHVLALVRLKGEDYNVLLDQSQIFLLKKDEVKKTTYSIFDLKGKELTRRRIDAIFT
ncbi:MAG: hypothetical protein PHI58_00595 [Candidatus Omnitrophica bacterium]|nr:hypothetical protein [Candidatus Omnitrophota bacterium]